MTTPPDATPITVTVKRDTSDAFRATAISDYDVQLALKRAGSINVDLTTDGREEFQIDLVDTLFRNARRALRRGKPALINLNRDALFEIVQKCRMRWEEAIASVKSTVIAAGGAGETTSYPYDEAWDRPVDAAAFRTIAGRLAVAGARLFESVFEKNRGTPLDDIAAKLRETARRGQHTLTVNAPAFHLPWRMLYTHPHATEELAGDGGNADPRGFWGYQHIIEEFTNDYEIKDHVLAKSGKLAFGAALHDRLDQEFKVDCLAQHRRFVQASSARLAYVEWTKKVEVETGLSSAPFRHQVVYFLCHAEGAGTTAKPSLQPPVLQLADGKIDAVELREYIRHRFEGNPPIVFINACRGAHLDTLVSHNFTFATEFLEQGAACLIGPQLEVPAVFAGEFGRCFFERLIARKKRPPQVGVILRDLTRFMWKQHNPFGLAYSLYAGADCHIRWAKRGPS